MDDITDLVDELAEIARTTTDPETGKRLMELIERLLRDAGLPPENGGGGRPPSDWVMELDSCPA
jgi:hypothetical protein